MALTKLTTDVNNIQKLADRPTETPTQLKAAFDKAGADIKEYINNTLTEEIDASFATKQEVADIYAGGVADNSISNAKLAPDVKIGSLDALNTTEKSSVVGAINSHLADEATKTNLGHLKLDGILKVGLNADLLDGLHADSFQQFPSKGSFVVADTLSANTQITKTIPLGKKYKRCRLLICSNANEYHNAIVECTRDSAEAFSYGITVQDTMQVITKKKSSYLIRVTSTGSSGAMGSGIRNTSLLEAYIDGTNLKLEMENSDTDTARTFNFTVYWEAW